MVKANIQRDIARTMSHCKQFAVDRVEHTYFAQLARDTSRSGQLFSVRTPVQRESSLNHVWDTPDQLPGSRVPDCDFPQTTGR